MNPIVNNYIKEAYASDQEILAAASKYYDDDDPEDPKRRWEHVLDDIEVAKKIRGRALVPVELGTLAFHDSGYKNPKGYMWGLKNHPKLSRKIFKKEAPGLGFNDDEIKHMAKVISYHMRTPKKGSPLLKDDLQMLMFGADEGTPKKPVDDARKYFMKAIAGRYPEVPEKTHPDFIKKLVERVRTFKDYSNAPGLEYYHRVYPNYHRDLYNYWHSDQIEKDYKQMLVDELAGKSIKQTADDNWSARTPLEDAKLKKKKEDKYSIHGAILGCLGNNAKKFKYNITEDLPGDPWEAIIHTKPMTMDKVRQFHSYHNVDVDGAGVPYYFLTKNERTGDKYVWYSDDAEPIRINTKEEIEYAQQVGRDKGLIPDQLNFKFTEKKASVDISDIVNAYKEQYGFDLSYMKGKHSKKPRYNNGKVANDIPVESYGGSWAKNNTIYLNPDMDAVAKYYGVDNTDDLRKTIVAHELAHEIYNKQATKEYIKKIVDEAKKKKFTTAYLKTVPERKIDEETFCEYLANGLNKKAKAITFPEEELASLIGKNKLYTTRVSKDYDKYKLGDTVKAPWGDKYTIDSEDIYDDILKHKFYDELTEEQKKELKKYKRMKLLGLSKKASKLYTYVEPDSDLSKGILSAALAPEDILMRRYKGHDYATSKEDILKFFDEMYPTRAKNVYALDAPIPDNANEQLIKFRNARKLVSFDAEQIKDLIKITRRRTNGPPIETTPDFEPRKHVKWGRDPKKVMKHPGRGPFHYAPVYALLTESGKIDPELLTIES